MTANRVRSLKSVLINGLLNIGVTPYLSLEALSSNTASFMDPPSRALARQRILVVFPVPGGPGNMTSDL